MKKTFVIPAIIAFIVIMVAEILMYTTAMLDGKYCLTESNYYLHVNSFASAFCSVI